MVEKATEATAAPLLVKIKAIGVGGGGGNAIAGMVGALQGIELIAVNTDHRALEHMPPEVKKVQFGEKLTRGFGVGGDPEQGRKAAGEGKEQLRQAASDADVVFIAAGMGGGTGTGVAPLLAEMAKESGALSIGIVTTPFSFEGEYRRQVAEEGIARLLEKVDTGIIIPNERLLSYPEYKTNRDWSLTDAFAAVTEVLVRAVKAIAKIIAVPGIINLDLSDIRTVMRDGGAAILAIGSASGGDRSTIAARKATYSHFLGFPITGARRALIYVTGKERLSLQEVEQAVRLIQANVDPMANIRFGVGMDPNMGEEVEVTVIATGFLARVLVPVAKLEEVHVPARAVEPIKRSEPFTHLRELELDIPSFTRRALSGGEEGKTSGATPPPARPKK